LIQDGILRLYVPKKSRKKPQVESSYSILPMGEVIDLTPKTKLPKSDFYIVVDRLQFSESDRGRLVDSLVQAYHFSLKYNLHLTKSRAEILTTEGKRLLLSEEVSCTICDHKFPDISSGLFSFNSPVGACPECRGFGNI